MRSAEVPSEPSAKRSGRLDSDCVDDPEGSQPVVQSYVASGVGAERLDAKTPACRAVECGSYVHVAMGVDTTGDAVGLCCHHGSDPSVRFIEARGHDREDKTATSLRQQAPMRSLRTVTIPRTVVPSTGRRFTKRTRTVSRTPGSDLSRGTTIWESPPARPDQA